MKLTKQATMAVVLAAVMLGSQVRSMPVRASQTRVEGVPPSKRGQDARDTTPAGVTTNAYPPVTAPPESFFEKVREKDRDAAPAFYNK